MVQQVNDDEFECEYLEILKESINQYKETIYSTTYEERIDNFCRWTPLGVFTDKLVKLTCFYMTTFIQIKQFHDFDEFRKYSVGKLLFQNYGKVFTYYVGDCLYVVVFREDFKSDVYLLHNSEEDEKLNLSNKEAVEIFNIWEYYHDTSIVLYFD